MSSILTCLQTTHEGPLLFLAAIVCVVGVYATYSIARHAKRTPRATRAHWTAIAMLAAGCTAWATHMIGLLSYRPNMQSAFDPYLTALSLLLTVAGIAASIGIALGGRGRLRLLLAGLMLGASIAVLHYLGQAAYLVTGLAVWDHPTVFASLAATLPFFGLSMVLSGERRQLFRRISAPLLVLAIAVLHFSGMAALQLQYDPRIGIPDWAISSRLTALAVASVCVGLLVLAVVGWRLSLSARAQARQDRFRFIQLADLAVEGLLLCDGEKIDVVNDSFARLSGFTPEELQGQPIHMVLPGLSVAMRTGSMELDAHLQRRSAEPVSVKVLCKGATVGTQAFQVIAVRDQSERIRTEARMRSLAYSDALTGLPNRLQFNETLRARCRSDGETQTEFALLLLDLDRFKSVNDTLGHVTGDALLKRVAGRLHSIGIDPERVSRLSGDEFAVIVDVVDAAEDLAEVIVDFLSRPFIIDGAIIDISTSIGMSVWPGCASDAEQLVRQADLALYAAKHSGGSCCEIYDPSMSLKAQARRELESDLRRALSREELEVHYQPQVDPVTGAHQGAEALVRWRHPVKGMISPAEFIPLAEEVGLIAPLGEWVLKVACEEARHWPDHVTVAVNLSPLQLTDEGLVKTVGRIIEESGLPPHRLELEITESALLNDEAMAHTTMRALRDMGIRISLDDFGTGYSSLSYLRRFPFNKIKIDRSFITHAPDDAGSAAIVKAVVALATALEMKVTVEGVETARQLAFTVAENCDQIQGYLVAKPMTDMAVRDFFDRSIKAVA